MDCYNLAKTYGFDKIREDLVRRLRTRFNQCFLSITIIQKFI